MSSITSLPEDADESIPQASPQASPDVIGGILREMNKQGIDMDLKKKNRHGEYEKADSNDMNMLKSQAKLANTAQALQQLDPSDRTAWALSMKDKANQMYADKDFQGALEIYMDALAASCFDESPNNNVENLVIPVVCNLAACCINLQEWSKALEFCNQALLLRPDNLRALTRRGAVHLHLNAYSKAKRDLAKAWDLASEDERLKLAPLIAQVQNGLKKDALAAEKQRMALKKAFEDRKIRDDITDDKAEEISRNRYYNYQDNGKAAVPFARQPGIIGTASYLFSLIFQLIVGVVHIILSRGKEKLGIRAPNNSKS